MRVPWGFLLGVAFFVGCGDATKKVSEDDQPPELPLLQVQVLQVETSPWPEVVKTQGSLIADEVTVVGAKVGGRVSEVHFDLGDSVLKGAPLVTLDQAEFKLQIVLAEAQRTQARAALGLTPKDPVESLNPENAPPSREAKAVWNESQTRIERTRALAARNAVTQNELDQAIADEGVAAARYSAALNGVREKIALIGVREAELSVAQQRLEDTVVPAPFDGRVQLRHVAPGAFLQVGQPVAILVRTSTLRFRGTIPERHAHRLSLGQKVTLHIESQVQPRVAKITRISPGVEVSNRSLMFEARLENENQELRTGMFAEAEVEVDAAGRALIIPHGTITEFAGVEKVWKLVDGVARETPIVSARRSELGVEVATGLSPGDLVLADATKGKVARVEATSTQTTTAFLAAKSEASAAVVPTGSSGDSSAQDVRVSE